MNRSQEVEEAIEKLQSYEDYSGYLKLWSVVYDYILLLEEKIKELENK